MPLPLFLRVDVLRNGADSVDAVISHTPTNEENCECEVCTSTFMQYRFHRQDDSDVYK